MFIGKAPSVNRRPILTLHRRLTLALTRFWCSRTRAALNSRRSVWLDCRSPRRRITTISPGGAGLPGCPSGRSGMMRKVGRARPARSRRRPGGVRSPRAGKAVDQPLGAVGLEIAAYLVKLLPGIAHHLAGAADIGEVCGQLQQRELAACYLVLGGHDRLPFGFDVVSATPSNPLESGSATGTGRSDSCGPRPVLRCPTVR